MQKPPSAHKETQQSYEERAAWYAWKQWGYDFSEIIRQFLSLAPGKRILDLGCGAGRDVEVFEKLGCTVTGIDSSPALLDFARRKTRTAKLLVMDFTQPLDFPDTAFDGIWASASLVHVPKIHLPKVLQECRRILAEQGILYIAVKYGAGEKFVEDSENGKRFFAFYRQEELEGYLCDAGFMMLTTQQRTKAEAHKEKEAKKKVSFNEVFVQVFARKI